MNTPDAPTAVYFLGADHVWRRIGTACPVHGSAWCWCPETPPRCPACNAEARHRGRGRRWWCHECGARCNVASTPARGGGGSGV